MFVKNYIAITIFSIYISFMFLIISGKFLIAIIIGIGTFLILIKLKKKQIKHDIDIETKYKLESIKKHKEDLTE